MPSRLKSRTALTRENKSFQRQVRKQGQDIVQLQERVAGLRDQVVMAKEMSEQSDQRADEWKKARDDAWANACQARLERDEFRGELARLRDDLCARDATVARLTDERDQARRDFGDAENQLLDAERAMLQVKAKMADRLLDL